MPSFDTLGEIILFVQDMDQMLSFFTEVLGQDVVEGTLAHNFVKLDTGDTMLCLHAGRESDVSDAEPKLVFEVEDLETAVEHLEAHDVSLGERRSPAPGVQSSTPVIPKEIGSRSKRTARPTRNSHPPRSSDSGERAEGIGIRNLKHSITPLSG